MKSEQGFSLIELLIVSAVILIIATIAIPGLRAVRNNANAGSAIQSLRTITTAEHLYQRKFKAYGTLAALFPEGTIDTNLAGGSKSGYTFTITLGPGGQTFACNATPQVSVTELEHFFVDETGIIRVNVGAPANAGSQALQR